MAGSKLRFIAALNLISLWIGLVSSANYQFQLQKIQKIEGEACDMTQIKVSNPNKDSMVLSGNVTVLQDFSEKAVVNLAGSEKKNGQYVRNMFMTKNNVDLCSLMSKNTDTLSEMGNVPSSCPIKAGTYNFKYTADTKRLPNTFPFGDNLKVTIEVLSKPGSEVLCKHDAYINVIKNQTKQQPRRRG